ncbi:MAG: P-type DNA transfer ATPase VirB11 [Pseudomonadota bacterium]
MSSIALNTFLDIFEYIFNKDIEEIMINKPHEIWCAQKGSYFQITETDILNKISHDFLLSLAHLIAEHTQQKISNENPLLSATLPNGFRVQIVLPPSTENIAYSIRKKTEKLITLDEYEQFGMFKELQNQSIQQSDLNDLLKNNYIKEFLSKAVNMKKNILISGGTSTGKTTFMNTLLSLIPSHERIITIEDVREISTTKHLNSLHLTASKGNQGVANVSIQKLIEASLRLRPNRLIIGELRGAEAFSFLRAINTGHPGSIATLHADSPQMAFEQLKLMTSQSEFNIPIEYTTKYIKNIINCIIQIKRHTNGQRYISEIYYHES